MSWGTPSAFALLWLLPLVAILLLLAARRRARDLEKLASAQLLSDLIPAGLSSLQAWRMLLVLLALLMFLLALAQPRVGFEWQDVEKKGIDLVVALDVSRSMDAADTSPSRMERARREILDLLEAAPQDRVGLVLFAGGAFPRVPLTLDHQAIRTILADVQTSSLRAQGTSIPGAIDAALAMLDQPNPSDRAIILISDGETEDPDAATAAAERARAAGVPIYVIGVGTAEGAPIPVEGGGFKKDRRGEMVVSRENTSLLGGLASQTGGAFVQSVASEEDVRALVDKEIHARLQATSRGTRRDKIWNEQYQWPLGLALACLVIAGTLGPRRSALLAMLPLAGLLSLSAPSTVSAGALQDGAAALQAGEKDRAIELLSQASLADPQDHQAALLLGEAYYRAGRFNEAERVWGRVAAQTGDPAERSLAEYNRGNAAYHAGRLTEAAQAFERAQQARKDFESARKNAEAVGREIAARMQQEPPPQQQPGEQGQQGEESQQEQSQQSAESSASEPAQDGEQQRSDEPYEPAEASRQAQASDESGEKGENTASSEAAAMQEGEEGEEEGAQVEGAQGGEMTAEQAHRLIDGVEEGSPRVIRGDETRRTQDW